VAHPRRHDLHDFLFRPRRRALLHRLRSPRRILAANRRRRPLRGHHVRLGHCPQSGLGPRNPPPGHGCAAHGPFAGAELYLAKTIANFLFVSIVQVILAPFFFVFYNLHIAGHAWQLALVLPLGTWALVVNGVFFAALSIGSRNREFLLSLILFPIFIPALLAMVQATGDILTGDGDPTLWIKMLLGYDIIFTTASLLLFDVVFHAE
jgi:hypothetical protein